jgi:hypothetical protein
MRSTFKLWTSLLPGSLLALLVAGGNSGNSTSLANVRRTFEQFNVSFRTPLPAHLMLTSGVGTQIPTDARVNFNPVVLFEVTFPQPGGAAPIQVTVPGVQLPQNGTEKIYKRYLPFFFNLITEK